MSPKNIFKNLICMTVCVGSGMLVGWLCGSEPDIWYSSLNKSLLTPPSYIFPIVWTVLYTVMGLVYARLWTEKDPYTKKVDLILFHQQWGLNLVWSFLFFKLHRPDLAFWDLIFLIVLNIQLLWRWKKKPLLFGLWLPYVVWLCFALYLNGVIYLENDL
jgi:benzodiazapine receptor